MSASPANAAAELPVAPGSRVPASIAMLGLGVALAVPLDPAATMLALPQIAWGLATADDFIALVLTAIWLLLVEASLRPADASGAAAPASWFRCFVSGLRARPATMGAAVWSPAGLLPCAAVAPFGLPLMMAAVLVGARTVEAWAAGLAGWLTLCGISAVAAMVPSERSRSSRSPGGVPGMSASAILLVAMILVLAGYARPVEAAALGLAGTVVVMAVRRGAAFVSGQAGTLLGAVGELSLLGLGGSVLFLAVDALLRNLGPLPVAMGLGGAPVALAWLAATIVVTRWLDGLVWIAASASIAAPVFRMAGLPDATIAVVLALTAGLAAAVNSSGQGRPRRRLLLVLLLSGTLVASLAAAPGAWTILPMRYW